jgi:hypothetical protein
MVCFQTKNTNLDKFWRVLDGKMLLYFMAIWNIYEHLWYFTTIWYIFSSCTKKNLASLSRDTIRNNPIVPARHRATRCWQGFPLRGINVHELQNSCRATPRDTVKGVFTRKIKIMSRDIWKKSYRCRCK